MVRKCAWICLIYERVNVNDENCTNINGRSLLSFQSSSIDFLASQGFDFNKVFCHGECNKILNSLTFHALCELSCSVFRFKSFFFLFILLCFMIWHLKGCNLVKWKMFYTEKGITTLYKEWWLLSERCDGCLWTCSSSLISVMVLFLNLLPDLTNWKTNSVRNYASLCRSLASTFRACGKYLFPTW